MKGQTAISLGVIDTSACDTLGEPDKLGYFADISARNPRGASAALTRSSTA